jgi:predicted nucleotidyltransferase
MHHDPLIAQIAAELRTTHGCHTVILYGSHARGDARPSSDYDLMGIRETGPGFRDARLWQGVYLDLFIAPESDLAQPDESLLKLRGGIVLFQKDNLGDALLARLDEMFLAGPKPRPPDEIAAVKVWAHKMIDRARDGDIEANYRRVWLLTSLLEDYFNFRHQWYLGPKQSFAWLKTHDPATHEAFQAALEPGASLDLIAALVERVTGI